MINRSYILKTYNPFLVGGIFVAWLMTWMVTSVITYHNTDKLFWLIILPILIFICYKFLGQYISVQISEHGVATNWAILPFFKKTFKEVEWDKIEKWKLSTATKSMAYTFYIKTKDGQRLYIRCLGFFKTPANLDDFVNDFKNTYSKINKISN
jgi:hypothetical protein